MDGESNDPDDGPAGAGLVHARPGERRDRDREDTDDGSPDAERIRGSNRLMEWLFLTGNRLAIAVGLSVGVYLLLTASHAVIGSISEEQTSPLFYLFGALTGGNLTLITIVISINQLVVSRQLGTPAELNDQIEATNVYREEIEETLPGVTVAPVTPTEFLHVLLRSSTSSIDAIGDEVGEIDDGEASDELLDVVGRLQAHVDHVESVLSRSDVDLFSALAATLNTNYSMDIYRLRQLRARYPEAYTETVYDELDRLVVRVQQIDVARQYLKTLYIQNELSRLSRYLLYVGTPAVLVSVFVLRLFSVGVGTFTPQDLFAFIPVALTVAVSPLAVLFAYVLRLSTVARRTVAITPFTTETQELTSQRPPADGRASRR